MNGFHWPGVSQKLKKRIGEKGFIIHDTKVFPAVIDGFSVTCMDGYYRTDRLLLRVRTSPSEVAGHIIKAIPSDLYRTEGEAQKIVDKARCEMKEAIENKIKKLQEQL